MKTLSQIISEIPKDKKISFAIGFAITILVSAFASYGIAFLCAVLVGFSKEIFDYITDKSKASVEDFLYVAAGALLGEILLGLITVLLFWIF